MKSTINTVGAWIYALASISAIFVHADKIGAVLAVMVVGLIAAAIQISGEKETKE